jgi:hypothetical protein
MFNVPATCPTILVVVGAIVTVVGWPLTTYLAYRSGFRSQLMRLEWEALKAKQALRQKFFDSANDLKTNVSVSDHPETWLDYFKDNIAKFISDYQVIRPDLAWKERKRIDEAMNSLRRFAPMNEDEIRAACRTDSELFDALKKLPEV